MSIFYTLQPVVIQEASLATSIVMGLIVGFILALVTNLILSVVSEIVKAGQTNKFKYLKNRPWSFWFQLFGLSMIVWTLFFSYSFYNRQVEVAEQYRKRPPEVCVGTLKGFFGETRMTGGKSKSETHFTYVVYNVNGYDISFLAHPGIPYPEKATIYRNFKAD